MNKLEVASENRRMTLIYEIALFPSVKIRANFDALHNGKGFQPLQKPSISPEVRIVDLICNLHLISFSVIVC